MGETTKRVNCTSCNKQLKIVKRYYRDNKYFCNKNCYKTFKAKQAEEQEKTAAEEQKKAAAEEQKKPAAEEQKKPAKE